MAHIGYKEFKTIFGDLGITNYVRTVYLEAVSGDNMAKVKLNTLTWSERTLSGKVYLYATMPEDAPTPTVKGGKYTYTYGLKCLPADSAASLLKYANEFEYCYAATSKQIYVKMPVDWTAQQRLDYVNSLTLFYKKA